MIAKPGDGHAAIETAKPGERHVDRHLALALFRHQVNDAGSDVLLAQPRGITTTKAEVEQASKASRCLVPIGQRCSYCSITRWAMPVTIAVVFLDLDAFRRIAAGCSFSTAHLKMPRMVS